MEDFESPTRTGPASATAHSDPGWAPPNKCLQVKCCGGSTYTDAHIMSTMHDGLAAVLSAEAFQPPETASNGVDAEKRYKLVTACRIAARARAPTSWTIVRQYCVRVRRLLSATKWPSLWRTVSALTPPSAATPSLRPVAPLLPAPQRAMCASCATPISARFKFNASGPLVRNPVRPGRNQQDTRHNYY
jgi:hypothetical protein